MTDNSPKRAATPVAAEAQASTVVPPTWLRPARRWVHRRPGGPAIWKVAIALVGAAVVVVGLALIPLPGPGWAIVFLGLAVWATEFVWAHRLLRYGQGVVRRWTAWVKSQSLAVRGLLGLAGVLLLVALGLLGWRLFR